MGLKPKFQHGTTIVWESKKSLCESPNIKVLQKNPVYLSQFGKQFKSLKAEITMRSLTNNCLYLWQWLSRLINLKTDKRAKDSWLDSSLWILNPLHKSWKMVRE